MFNPIFFHNYKYLLLKLWEIVKTMKMDVNRRFFFQNRKKNYNVGKTEIKVFLFYQKNYKFIDIRFRVLNHFPKFERKIFIIMDKRWVKLNYSYGNYFTVFPFWKFKIAIP